MTKKDKLFYAVRRVVRRVAKWIGLLRPGWLRIFDANRSIWLNVPVWRWAWKPMVRMETDPLKIR